MWSHVKKNKWHGYAVVPYVWGGVGYTSCSSPCESSCLLQATSKASAVALQAKGSNSRPSEVRSRLQSTVCFLFSVVHWAEWTETRTTDKGAQKSGGHSRFQLVSYSRTCLDKQSHPVDLSEIRVLSVEHDSGATRSIFHSNNTLNRALPDEYENLISKAR